MENLSLYQENKRPITHMELFKLMCKFTQCRWGDEHMPCGIRICVRGGGEYIVRAGVPEVEKREEHENE